MTVTVWPTWSPTLRRVAAPRKSQGCAGRRGLTLGSGGGGRRPIALRRGIVMSESVLIRSIRWTPGHLLQNERARRLGRAQAAGHGDRSAVGRRGWLRWRRRGRRLGAKGRGNERGNAESGSAGPHARNYSRFHASAARPLGLLLTGTQQQTHLGAQCWCWVLVLGAGAGCWAPDAGCWPRAQPSLRRRTRHPGLRPRRTNVSTQPLALSTGTEHPQMPH